MPRKKENEYTCIRLVETGPGVEGEMTQCPNKFTAQDYPDAKLLCPDHRQTCASCEGELPEYSLQQSDARETDRKIFIIVYPRKEEWAKEIFAKLKPYGKFKKGHLPILEQLMKQMDGDVLCANCFDQQFKEAFGFKNVRLYIWNLYSRKTRKQGRALDTLGIDLPDLDDSKDAAQLEPKPKASARRSRSKGKGGDSDKSAKKEDKAEEATA